MKLTVNLDLAPHRTNAIEAIDAHFNREVMKISSVPAIHALKLAKAQDAIAGKTPDPQLVAEAALRNVDIHVLCMMIFQKSADADAAILALETKRQEAKKAIADAASQQAIQAVARAHQSFGQA